MTASLGAGVSLADELVWRLRDQAAGASAANLLVSEAAVGIVDQVRSALGHVTQAETTVRPWWQEPPPLLILDEFLGPAEMAKLLAYVRARSSEFSPATLVGGDEATIYIDPGYRLADTLFDVEPFRNLFETRLGCYLDFVCARLGCAPFEDLSFELQLTATRSGGFFRVHDDNSHPANRSRRLTFVYYFFFEPLRWSGGALRFVPSEAGAAPIEVLPAQNRLVFFESSRRHEVMPYISETDSFEGARFTINGWIHQESWG